jgi:hypothetical protein
MRHMEQLVDEVVHHERACVVNTSRERVVNDAHEGAAAPSTMVGHLEAADALQAHRLADAQQGAPGFHGLARLRIGQGIPPTPPRDRFPVSVSAPRRSLTHGVVLLPS